MTVIAGAALLVLAVVIFLLHPMLTGLRASLSREADEPTEAEARRRVALLALRDVEYDHATGKLGDEDYHALRRELAAEALAALQEVEAEAAQDRASTVEGEVIRLRGGLAVGSTCSACGSPNGLDDRFCTYCGTPLQPAGGGTPGTDGAPVRSRSA